MFGLTVAPVDGSDKEGRTVCCSVILDKAGTDDAFQTRPEQLEKSILLLCKMSEERE